MAQDDAVSDPRNYAEAMARPNATKWEAVCDDERHVFERMSIYKVVPRPKGRKVVGSKWVFCIKCRSEGSIKPMSSHKASHKSKALTTIRRSHLDET
jgi:hypothetical protein